MCSKIRYFSFSAYYGGLINLNRSVMRTNFGRMTLTLKLIILDGVLERRNSV
jgi:hypothetical protein